MTLTKLQNLYRAAVAVAPNLNVSRLEIDEHGQWVHTIVDREREYEYSTILRDWQAAHVIGFVLDYFDFKMKKSWCYDPFTEDVIEDALKRVVKMGTKRIARKEASK